MNSNFGPQFYGLPNGIDLQANSPTNNLLVTNFRNPISTTLNCVTFVIKVGFPKFYESVLLSNISKLSSRCLKEVYIIWQNFLQDTCEILVNANIYRVLSQDLASFEAGRAL